MNIHTFIIGTSDIRFFQVNYSNYKNSNFEEMFIFIYRLNNIKNSKDKNIK